MDSFFWLEFGAGFPSCALYCRALIRSIWVGLAFLVQRPEVDEQTGTSAGDDGVGRVSWVM